MTGTDSAALASVTNRTCRSGPRSGSSTSGNIPPANSGEVLALVEEVVDLHLLGLDLLLEQRGQDDRGGASSLKLPEAVDPAGQRSGRGGGTGRAASSHW
jgi:hypothetical protein